jgi:hypothetical protein
VHVQVDALRHDQVQVQKLLRSKGGQLLGMDVSVELCEAASNVISIHLLSLLYCARSKDFKCDESFLDPSNQGNVARMKDLITNGANPNAGDYDARTGVPLEYPVEFVWISSALFFDSSDIIFTKSALTR